MNQIYFITSAPIQYEFGRLNIYQSFTSVSKGEVFAPLSLSASDDLNGKKFEFQVGDITNIFTASSGQTLETGKMFVKHYKHLRLVSTELLNPILFDMENLISEKDFFSMDLDNALNVARTNFVKSFYKGKLKESKNNLVKRFDQLLQLLKSNPKSVVIGHAFFLKLLEIYLFNKEAFESEDALLKAFNPNQRPFNALEGFVYLS